MTDGIAFTTLKGCPVSSLHPHPASLKDPLFWGVVIGAIKWSLNVYTAHDYGFCAFTGDTYYCLIQAEAEVKEIQKQLKRNMDEMENYKLLKYVIIIQYCTKECVCVCFFGASNVLCLEIVI